MLSYAFPSEIKLFQAYDLLQFNFYNCSTAFYLDMSFHYLCNNSKVITSSSFSMEATETRISCGLSLCESTYLLYNLF